MRRHATDLVSLIFGLIFVVGAGWWFTVNYLNLTINWELPHLGWFLAGGLIVLGLLGVAASLRREPPAAEPATVVQTTPANEPATAVQTAATPAPAPSFMAAEPEPSFMTEPQPTYATEPERPDNDDPPEPTQEMDADRRG